MRSQEDILARFNASDSMFGFDREVLIGAMSYDTVEPLLRKGHDESVEAWTYWDTTEKIREQAGEYLVFAIEKAIDHRGISASRSVDKLTEFAWLLERDDVMQAMHEAEYPQYGVPKLRVFARMLDFTWPTDNTALERMADGRTCEDNCMEGCGT